MKTGDWYEDDELWRTVRPVLFTEARLEAAAEEIEKVQRLLGLEPPARLLDMPCGVGRHTVELARRGFQVTAVDRTRAYLDEARERAERAGVSVEFVEADMREFLRPGAFDGAVNLFSSFGYFEEEEDDRRVARHLAESLRPGGVLLLDTVSKETLARDFEERGWSEADGVFLLQERSISRDFTWVTSRWIIVPPRGDRVELDISMRLYSARELSDLLAQAGFKRSHAFGSLEGAPFDHKAERLVLLTVR